MSAITSYQDAADEILTSQEAFSVDFDQAWKWLGYTQKGTAKRALQDNYLIGTDFLLCISAKQNLGKGGHNREEIRLTLDCFKAFCMMAGTAKGKEVRAYFIRRDNELRKIESERREITPVEVTPVQRFTIFQYLYAIADASRWNLETVITLGNLARRLGRALEIPTERVQHEKFGSLGTWPEEVWRMAILQIAKDRHCWYPPFLAAPDPNSGVHTETDNDPSSEAAGIQGGSDQ